MKQTKYHHLTQYNRDRIQAMLSAGHKQKDIANVLKVSKSTISREIQRNRRKNNVYDAQLAHHKAYVKRRYSKVHGKKIHTNHELEKYIIDRLKKHWSPDEISGRMRLENKSFYASKTAIYDWLYSIYGQRYCYLLPSRQFKPKKRRVKIKRAMIPNRIGIENRAKDINHEYAHYEGDTIVSKKSTKSLAVLCERKSKYVRIRKINNLKPHTFNSALNEMRLGIKKIKSLTLDNGIENRYWEELDIEKVYFCDPYSSWQKGGVENMNKMIRKYVLKGSDISKYSHRFIQRIENILNHKPRKSLGYKTPYEIMIENDLLIKKCN